jgi:general L-amino acid transport system substrate-binding protein
MRIFIALGLCALCTSDITATGPRLELIQKRGFLACGIESDVPGFAEVDTAGRHHGFDIDVCRAIAAVALGTPEKVKFVPVLSAADFLKSDEVDVVSRRLTWELRREAALPLLFGPITFYDGQGFLVSKALKARTIRQLSGLDVCVAGGTNFEFNAGSYFQTHHLTLKKVVLESAADFPAVANALATGKCRVYTADVSELAAIRLRLAKPDGFEILEEQISREPLAPLVRQDDPNWFVVVRWTILALINAEELGVTSTNADDMRKNPNVDVQRLLGVVEGNGKALGLRESWAYDAIKAVGNYGEMFEKNIGRGSRIGLDRGLNRLARDGGLMYAPPLR